MLKIFASILSKPSLFNSHSLKTSMLLKRTTNSKILCPSNMHRNCKQFSTLAIEEVAITAVRCPRIKPKNNQNHPNVQSFFLFECQIPYKARVGYKWVYIHTWPSPPLHPNPHFNHRLAQTLLLCSWRQNPTRTYFTPSNMHRNWTQFSTSRCE